jgi:cytochrome c peroxidase
MKRIVKGTIFTLFICIGLSACGEKEKVMAPTNLPSEKQETAQNSEITPEELFLRSLNFHDTLKPEPE